MSGERLAVMSITKQVADPLTAGFALGTAMRLENAMRSAEAGDMATAAINLADLKFLIEYVTPFIQRVGEVICQESAAKDEEAKALEHAKAEMEKLKAVRDAWKAGIPSPYGSRVR